jgi:DUF971 family protein
MASNDPASVDISKSAGITVEWKDGHHSEYQLQYLRDRCPCANCGSRGHGQQAQPTIPGALPMFKPRPKIQDVEPIGHYALRLYWSDGHSTGIYSYDYLRSICPCEECKKLTA